MKLDWTMAKAIKKMPEHVKERLFDLWVEGVLPLDPEALEILADRVYPPNTEVV